MPISIKLLSEYRRAPGLRALKVEALSPKERRIYDLLEARGPLTTRAVGASINSSLASAGNMLTRLMRYGLVSRGEIIDRAGRHFEWRVK